MKKIHGSFARAVTVIGLGVRRTPTQAPYVAVVGSDGRAEELDGMLELGNAQADISDYKWSNSL